MRFSNAMKYFTLLWTLRLIGLYHAANEEYRGKPLGKINSYHHQVFADVYAVDEYTFLLAGFTYDGTGTDTFFWAGASSRPGPQGFIVPNEYGTTNILTRYFNKDIKITLPDKKKLTDIKWFAVYDITRQTAFGDVYIPEDFEPPATQTISQITGKSHGVTSGSLELLNAKTIKIPGFSYNGAGEDTYFLVGVGSQPTAKGHKVPDEYGYMDSLRPYSEETIIIELPGELTIFNIDWLSVYDIKSQQNFGFAIIPEAPNVPPSLGKVLDYKSNFPNCIQLHKQMQVSWEIFGPQITIQLAGQVDEDHYLAFGLSGSDTRAQMKGSDITIAYIDGYRGFVDDYNITELSACTKVLGQYKGVCKDELVGGMDNNQLHTSIRKDGIDVITYRRHLISADPGDKEFKVTGFSQLVWAIGRLYQNKEPAIHQVFPRNSINVELNGKDPIYNCFSFTSGNVTTKLRNNPWEVYKVIDRSVRVFTAILGPSGGENGYYKITGQPSSGLIWYIDGKPAPEIWMRRGLSYAFRVLGGNNPHDAEYYNPLIITDDPHGGYEHLNEQAQKQVKVLAGIQFTLRGQPRPTTAGPLCIAKRRGTNRRLDDEFETFEKFNRTLEYFCNASDPAVLHFTPNSSWPDVVYYNSYTRFNMGWKIHIVDNFNLPMNNVASATRHKIISIVSSIMIGYIGYVILRYY